jgi:GNAT superfamily N-acetyltransferase
MMNELIIIESAKIDDLPKIEPLLRDLLDAIDDSDKMGTKLAIDNCRQMIADPNSYILLARLEKDIVGLVNFTIRKTILHNAPSALIDELVVAKANRGRGIGRQLIEAAIKKCRELDCCEIEVSTEKTNEKARAFYKKCGFDEDAVLLEYDFD